MRLDHVGIAVLDLDEGVELYRRSFGLELVHREELPAQGTRVAFLAEPGAPGGATVELLEPLGSDGAVGRFIASRGPGLHHVAFHTDDINGDMERLGSDGRPPLEGGPRAGARGHSVCFIHPKHMAGVLVELVGPA